MIGGGSGTDTCEAELTRLSCEVDLPPSTGEGGTTTIARVYDGDSLMVSVDVTHPDQSVDVYALTWDRVLPIPQIIGVTVNGETTSLVYGANRAFGVTTTGTTAYQYSVLGDTQTGPLALGGGFDPYGQPTTPNPTSLGFGYRGELHIGTHVYLRFRDLDPALGRFTTKDPLEGVPGTTTVANQYAYASNDPVQKDDPLGMRPGDGDVNASLDLDVSAFEAFRDLSSIEIAGFIPEEFSRLPGLGIALYQGDNRDFVPGSFEHLSNRFFVGLDFDTGETRIHVNETCDWDGVPCWPALPIVIADPGGSRAELFFARLSNWFYFQKEVGGEAVRIGWSVLHGDTSTKAPLTRVPFDGHVTVRPVGANGLQVVYEGDCFPNLESDVISDGRRVSVIEFRHRGPEQGLAIAGNCRVTSTSVAG